MKKSLCVFLMAILSFVCVSSFAEEATKLTTVEYKVEGRKNAVIKMTETYRNEYWVEFYLVYEESNKTYDEAETEKAIYEFLSNYKRDNVFARVEIEDLKGTTIGKSKTSMQKRVIFRHLRK